MKTITIVLLVLSVVWSPVPSRAADGVLLIEWQLARERVDGAECDAGLNPDGSLAFTGCGVYALAPTDAVPIAAGGTYTRTYADCPVLLPEDAALGVRLDLAEVRGVTLQDGTLTVIALRRTGARFPSIPGDLIDAVTAWQHELYPGSTWCNARARAWQILAPQYGLTYTALSATEL